MKELKLYLLGFTITMVLGLIAKAQDSTVHLSIAGGITLPGWWKIALSILVGVYEIVVRYIPTVRNYSIIGWIIQIIQTLVPNKSVQGPEFP
jgi:hypothetical protein